MEFRATVTVAEHGYEEENGERFLEGFLATHPQVGAVISQNIAKGTLSVTFAVDSDDVFEASDAIREVFGEGVAASGLEPVAVLGVEIAVVQEEPTAEREPVPV